MPKGAALTDKEIARIIEMHLNGVNNTSIGKELGRHRDTITKVLKDHVADIAGKKNETQQKAITAQLKGGITGVDDADKSADKSADNSIEDVSARPADVKTLGVKHNFGVKVFSEGATEASNRMKGAYADNLVKQFQEDLEMIPAIRSLKNEFSMLYEKEDMNFIQFITVAAKLFAERIRDVQGLYPVNVLTTDTDANKDLDINGMFNRLLLIKVIEKM